MRSWRSKDFWKIWYDGGVNRVVKYLMIVVLGVFVLGVAWFLLRRSIEKEEIKFVGDNMEVTEEVRGRYQESELGLSENSEKINLRGEENRGMGMATREKVGEIFTHTILANLVEPGEGKFYEGWLIRESDNSRVYTGKLELSKGGWLLEYVGRQDLSEYKLVWVTLEGNDDQRPEEKVLEGKFK